MRGLRIAVTALLLAFVGVSFAYLGFRDRGTQADGPREDCAASTAEICRPDAGADPASNPRVVAYYFHMTKRCKTCRTIETLARDAIETGFAEAILQGRLAFESVNVEDPGNEHFVREYEVAGSSLVLAEVRAGRPVRSRHLAEVWNLVADPQAFTAYVQSEVRSFLAAGGS